MDNKQFLVVINKKDIRRIFIDMLGISIANGSPFYNDINTNYPPAPGRTGEFDELLNNITFRKAAKIIASPDLIVVNRIGGGSVGLEEVRLLRRKDEGDLLAAVSEGENGSYIIKVFDNFTQYLNWWVEKFAGKNEETVANFIPPKVSLESFLFVLHAIDSFRRVSYQNMLEYKMGERASMRFSDFSSTMSASIKSRDIRWLLPAFMVMTPGLDSYRLDMRPENVSILTEQNITANSKNPATGEDMLVFGEAGQAMGVEFYRTWMMSTGFEIRIMTPQGFKGIERMFLAPTALANHFVRLETLQDGRCMINHQAYTKEQLEVKLDEIFKKAFSVPVQAQVHAPVQPQAHIPAPSPIPSQIPVQGQIPVQNQGPVPPTGTGRCPKCGAGITPGMKFCNKCGTPFNAQGQAPPVQPNPMIFCTNCGAPMSIDARFCTKCGQPR